MAEEHREELRALAMYLVGPAEIADLLKVEANTVNVWKIRHGDFPPSLRSLKSGDIWDIREVKAWAEKTRRYPPPQEQGSGGR